ncbi:MAG TPA: UDP-N-acetylmuramoyl-tripeptide--D-alanyl-D-alanine ligase [Chitinophagaceae bacterium]|nr:UDP-N-acetylmuramoyl-tripeptide--D-alanyl-D-alanine ligase [Chitinophagaceae bacterium]
MDIEAIYKLYLQFPSVQTDTRLLKKGDIFFALKGENFNGNAFAQKAIESGASFAIIDEQNFSVPQKTILVPDVLKTLQQLAKHHREQFSIPFLAITGSNGKTTTKELIHSVLSSTYTTYTTRGNLNNHIGIPLTLLRIRNDAELAVIEMGANHLREIAGYCEYAQPTHGIITNCGKAHLEGFGGVEGVRKGKGELFDYIRSKKGTVFVMKDYEYLAEMSKGITSVYSYGTSDADVTGNVVKNNPFLEISVNKSGETFVIKSQLVGEYNLPNILAAVAVGNYFKIPSAKIKSAIENYSPSNSRSQLLERGTNKIILDAYNANPSSMKLAIQNFANLKADNKILILGAMAELGDASIAEHKAIVDFIDQFHWKDVILVGGDFMNINHPYKKIESAEDAGRWIKEKNLENTYMLIKGSRSMKLEKVLDN